MRVLVADRNAWLLESIYRTFARQCSIQTATTHQHCNFLLLLGGFDLVIVSESLADGPGLKLLAKIARDSPGTLRVFAATGSRLQLLKGKLGLFGLFRTLTYPVDPRKIRSVLTLARAALEVEVPAPATRRVAVVRRQAPTVPATRESAAPPWREQHSRVSMPARVVRQTSGVDVRVTGAQARTPSGAALRHRPRAARAVAPAPPRDAPAPPRRTSAPPSLSQAAAACSTMRTKVMLGATMVVIFLVTTLTLNVLDASAHLTHASIPQGSIARAEIERPQSSAPPQDSMPVASTPSVAPKPDSTKRDVSPQVAASSAPMADPASFGSEAYEPIYSN